MFCVKQYGSYLFKKCQIGTYFESFWGYLVGCKANTNAERLMSTFCGGKFKFVNKLQNSQKFVKNKHFMKKLNAKWMVEIIKQFHIDWY